MSRLGRLGSKIEGGNNANRDSSNQQFTHGTLLCSVYGAWVLLKAYTLRLTKFITSRRLGLWLRRATPDLGITVQCKTQADKGSAVLAPSTGRIGIASWRVALP